MITDLFCANEVLWLIKLLLVIALWTLIYYFLHRIAHVRHKRNWLHKLHLIHHRTDYRKGGSRFRPGFLLFYFGDIRVTLDTLLMMTSPLVALTFVFPSQGMWVLLWHYINEVFLAERVLEHNPYLGGRLTQVFAWGTFHLKHHKNPRTNFGLLITLWDDIFNTAYHAKPNVALSAGRVGDQTIPSCRPVYPSNHDVEQKLLHYFTEVLEVPQVDLGGLPVCPFIRGERMSGRIHFLSIQSGQCVKAVAEAVRKAFSGKWGHTLLLYDAYDAPEGTDLAAFGNFATAMNKEFRADGLVCIAIHPRDNFKIGNVPTREAPLPVYLIQSARQVMAAQAILRNTNYYRHWTESDWNRIKHQFGDFLPTAFPEDFCEHLIVSPLIEILGGREIHSFLETYMVITDDCRVFSRTLMRSSKSWFVAIQRTGVGLVKYNGKMIRVRGEKLLYDPFLNEIINQLYLEKYQDPEDVPFVKKLIQPEYGQFTMEFYFDGVVREQEALNWSGGVVNHPAHVVWGVGQ